MGTASGTKPTRRRGWHKETPEELLARARNQADPDPVATARRQEIEWQRVTFFTVIGVLVCCFLPENFRQHFRSEAESPRKLARFNLILFVILALGWIGAIVAASVLDGEDMKSFEKVELSDLSSCPDQTNCHDCTRSYPDGRDDACEWCIPEDGGDGRCVLSCASLTGEHDEKNTGDCLPERPERLFYVLMVFIILNALGFFTALLGCLIMAMRPIPLPTE